MPMTRTARADYAAQYAGWSPHERAYFIGRLFGIAQYKDVDDPNVLRGDGGLQRIATQMNSNFHPRRFSIAVLRDMLHRIRLEYVDFCEFLENPWVDYDPHDMEVSVLAPYWQTVDPLPPPPEVVGSFEWPIHVRTDNEDALAIIPFNMEIGNVSEATPSPPVRENDNTVIGSEREAGGAGDNVNGLFSSGSNEVDYVWLGLEVGM